MDYSKYDSYLKDCEPLDNNEKELVQVLDAMKAYMQGLQDEDLKKYLMWDGQLLSCYEIEKERRESMGSMAMQQLSKDWHGGTGKAG